MRFTQIHKAFRLVFILITLTLLSSNLAGCIEDSKFDTPLAYEKQTLKISIAAASLRNDTEQSDNNNFETRIDKISLLVFEKEKNGKEYLFSVGYIDKKVFNKDKNIYELEVTINKPSNKSKTFDLVFIANHDLPKTIHEMLHKVERTERRTVFNKFFFKTESDTEYLWKSPKNGNEAGFPMWAEIQDVRFTEEEDFPKENIMMYRAISRFDFGFNIKKEGDNIYIDKDVQHPYQIASIRVYNIPEEISTVPDKNSLYWNGEFVAPTIPNDVHISKVPYTVLLDQPTADLVTQEIYLPENHGGRIPNNNSTYFVIGVYSEDFINPEDQDNPHVKYFRADLMNLGNNNSNPIIRNTRYLVDLKNIDGEGHNTPELASSQPLRSSKSKINAQVNSVQWNNPQNFNYN